MPVYRDQSDSIVTQVSGTGIVVRGNDVDTDRIIPARFLKVVTFDGIGQYAFQDVRVDEHGATTDHPFNNPDYRQASVLFVNKNFGCGSSREHAPQALMRWGIKAIVGESFAEIFAGNCNALGVPAVTVSAEDARAIMDNIESDPTVAVAVDLASATVRVGSAEYRCEMPTAYLQSLTGGTWDSTALLLQNTDAINSTAASLPYLNGFT